MKIKDTELKDALIFELDIHSDKRGFFKELWSAEKYLGLEFKQDNISSSEKGILRGLHFQNPNPQGKLVTVLKGKVLDVIVDLRKSSPTYKHYQSFFLSDKIHTQLFVPKGFAHGFVSLENDTLFHYKCTELYDSSTEECLIWNDPELEINWLESIFAYEGYVISEKDKKGKTLKQLENENKVFS